jgi:A nuclease family of the HNH/ENDO VII superfamily with conserved AHH
MTISLPRILRTPAQMNTALAQDIKAVLVLTLEDGARIRDLVAKLKALPYPPPPAEPEPGRADRNGDETPGGHVSSTAPAVAVLAKDTKYARRGVRFIKDQNGRGVYQKFDHLDAIRSISESDLNAVKEAARFPGGPKHNFNLSFGMRFPYIWRAHHILPGSAFYYETKDGPIFRPEHFEILLQTEYNVNSGHNVILLPFEDWAVLVHALIQHPSDHPTYTQGVMTRLGAIARQLQASIKENRHDQAKKDFLEELRSAEDDFWDALVALGGKVARGLISGPRYQSKLVKYETQGGKSQAALA